MACAQVIALQPHSPNATNSNPVKRGLPRKATESAVIYGNAHPRHTAITARSNVVNALNNWHPIWRAYTQANTQLMSSLKPRARRSAPLKASTAR